MEGEGVVVRIKQKKEWLDNSPNKTDEGMIVRIKQKDEWLDNRKNEINERVKGYWSG
jgi:hypothetical protein